MLHVDIPTQPEIRSLIETRANACVSIYVPTTRLTQHVAGSRIAFGNLTRTALEQLDAVGFDKRRRALLNDELDGLGDDDEFWRLQAHSLVVLATPDRLRTYRPATTATETMEVSDRLHLKPLLRAMAFPQHAFVLALSENDARLVEVFADLPPTAVNVPGLPDNAADATGHVSAEGQKTLLLKYARKVDAALRPVLVGRETPLILASTEPLGPIFRSLNSYPALLAEGVSASPDRMSESELASATRAVLDGFNTAQIETLKTAYATIKGFEGMRALRKGQASAFNITRNIRGEARIVERAFGLGVSVLAEAVQFVSERLELKAA